MGEYQIVIHLRDSDEPTRIPLPGVPGDVAEADRQALLYDIEQARLVEAPLLPFQTRSGHPEDGVTLDAHSVTEIDLVEAPTDL